VLPSGLVNNVEYKKAFVRPNVKFLCYRGTCPILLLFSIGPWAAAVLVVESDVGLMAQSS